jgi:hypothetical protein
MSDLTPNQEPLQIEIVKPKRNKKATILIVGLFAVIGGATGSYFVFHKSTPDAPTLKQITSNILKDWNKNDAYWATKNQTVSCAYDPTKYTAGYRFECDIFNGKSTGIGTAQVLVNAAKGNSYFDFTISLQPN